LLHPLTSGPGTKLAIAYATPDRRLVCASRLNGSFLPPYLHVQDAADGCRLALESNPPGHEMFNLCAPTTLMPEPTIDLVRRLMPEITDFRRTDRSNWAGYDTAKARNVLGFEATRLVTL
jgi:nucleoside-diphosphate-sugar epimerase